MRGKKLTGPQQRNAFSQGIALGLSVLERYEFEFNTIRIDLAFEQAWDEWPAEYRAQFSQVNTDLKNGTNPVWVMTRAQETTRSATPLFWDTSDRPIKIYQRGEDWDSDNPSDGQYALRMVGTDVPLDGWVSLAKEFLTAYDRWRTD